VTAAAGYGDHRRRCRERVTPSYRPGGTKVSSRRDVRHCRADPFNRCTARVTANRPAARHARLRLIAAMSAASSGSPFAFLQRCLLATNVFVTDDGHCRAHLLAI